MKWPELAEYSPTFVEQTLLGLLVIWLFVRGCLLAVDVVHQLQDMSRKVKNESK